MNIVRLNYSELPVAEPRICCIGNFDGVHLGHRRLFERVSELAKEQQCLKSVITFDPTSKQLFNPDQRVLTTLEQKTALFAQLGADEIIILHFDEALMKTDAIDFINYLNQFSLKKLICGFDFMFGYLGKGNVITLKEDRHVRFPVEVIEPVKYYGEKISSTRITQAIKRGEITKAEKMLGHDYNVIFDENNVSSNVMPEVETYRLLKASDGQFVIKQ